ncbi:hypothetical protein SNEBB_001853 [Seison nebaliae]|nr:hypothetical protein SNEBB_001853 [Seison nebaliae]
MYRTLIPIRWTIILTMIHISLILGEEIDLSVRVLYAVNCGGGEVLGAHNIRYEADSLAEGIASDYGKNLLIQGCLSSDRYIYETERYNTDSFSYGVRLPMINEVYVVWLKFSEVWFAADHMKLFNVRLNNEHIVVNDLDIHREVGRGHAYDIHIPIEIKGKKLIVDDETSSFDGNLIITFEKTNYDNPKINGIVIVKGKTDDLPKLPKPELHDHFADQMEVKEDQSSIIEEDDDMEEEEEEEELNSMDDFMDHSKSKYSSSSPSSEKKYVEENSKKETTNVKSQKQKFSGPPAINPDDIDVSTYFVPILMAIGIFIPTLFFLCRM